MRFTASADLTALRRVLALVIVDPPEIEVKMRLLAVAVMARVLAEARRKDRSRDVEDVKVVPVV